MRYALVPLLAVLALTGCTSTSGPLQSTEAITLGERLYQFTLAGDLTSALRLCGDPLSDIDDPKDHDRLVDPCNILIRREPAADALAALRKVVPPSSIRASETRVAIDVTGNATASAIQTSVWQRVETEVPTR
jgi:hypothetical protein